MSGAAQHDFDLRARQSVLPLMTDKRNKSRSQVGANDKLRLAGCAWNISTTRGITNEVSLARGVAREPREPS